MKKTTLILIVLFVFSGVYQSFASERNEPVKKLLINYISAINSLGQGSGKKNVLKLFSDRYEGNTTLVKISGTIVRKNYKKKDIASQMDDIINDNNYTFKLTLDKVIYISQKDKAGTISAIVNFQSFIDNKLAEKGTMLMNLVGVLQKGHWQIVNNNMVRVSEAKDIGDCVCYVYSKGSTKFVTEIYFPAGVEYSQDFESFKVTSIKDKRVIKSESNEFFWDKDTGKLSYKGKVIGKAEDSRKAIEAALINL